MQLAEIEMYMLPMEAGSAVYIRPKLEQAEFIQPDPASDHKHELIRVNQPQIRNPPGQSKLNASWTYAERFRSAYVQPISQLAQARDFRLEPDPQIRTYVL